jgi:hypothetical protein
MFRISSVMTSAMATTQTTCMNTSADYKSITCMNTSAEFIADCKKDVHSMSMDGCVCDPNNKCLSKCTCESKQCTCIRVISPVSQLVGIRGVTDTVLEGQFNDDDDDDDDDDDSSSTSDDDNDDDDSSSNSGDDDDDDSSINSSHIYDHIGNEVDVVDIGCNTSKHSNCSDRTIEFLKYGPAQFLNMMTQTWQLYAGFSSEQTRGKTGWVVKMYVEWLSCKYVFVSHFHTKKRNAKASVVDAFHLMASAQVQNRWVGDIEVVAYYVFARVPDIVNMFQKDSSF